MNILKEFDQLLLQEGIKEFDDLVKAGAPRTEDIELCLQRLFKTNDEEILWFMNAIFLARPQIHRLKSIRVATLENEDLPEGARILGSGRFGDHVYIPVY